jgi:pimeloyl-ACP methyl ester carboxylesterase
MVFKEYGTKKNETIMLLHGGGLSWWNYRSVAQQLQQDYRIILPVLDGHAGSGRKFTSIEDNAAEIISFVDHELGGTIKLLGGLSLGAQIVLEILLQKNDICRYAIVESASVIPSGLTNALIAPAFGSSYGLIKNRGFAKLQFRSLHMRPDLFEEYYRDTCQITKSDMIAFLKANTSYEQKQALQNCQAEIRIVVGGKEQKTMLRSARMLHGMLPKSRLEIKDGLYHGEYSINHPDLYVKELRDMLRKSGQK